MAEKSDNLKLLDYIHDKRMSTDGLLAKWREEVKDCHRKEFHCGTCRLVAKIMDEMITELEEALK